MRDYDYTDLKDLASDSDHKAAMLALLLEFDRFCEEHGLTYYLSGGTLLGAARHKGFIPWDDDVDVNMPRADCEKLMELSGGRIGDFELMPPNSSPRYFAYHWKLYSEAILVAKRTKGGVGGKVYPIFLDIFPIDGLPDTEAGNVEHYAEIKRRKDRVRHARNVRRYRGLNPYRIVRNRVATRVYRAQGVGPLFDKVIELATSIGYDDSDYVGVMMTNVHTTEERVVKSEYAPVVRMEFEGHPLSCPAGYDTYLRQLYGPDYMEWLPVHKRVPRHDFVTFFPYGPGEKPRTTEDELQGAAEEPVADDDEMLDELA
ncbi:phosphorylcholine transferase LicD [Microbacterium fluvii]|uniref:Phosphorylcholine transferase LicD n=1 Tax=Microbacterium fluvii TaxID=415215 RepID=A0ABW2HBH8_9MICO|nr:LicD family protein [Microbacterium fluvii]MCU4671422.1 LicD family protein [Microbacterium fluvii]